VIGRRLAAVVAILGVALAALVLPAAAQPSPVISLQPSEAPAGPSTETWSIVVSGQNWSSGTITIQFAGQTVGSTSPRTDGTFDITITPAKRSAGFYQVTALQNPCAPRGDCTFGRQATFRSIPQSSHSNPCGPFGTTVNLTVTGSFFPPQTFGYVDYDPNGPDQQSRSRIPTGSGTFTATFSVVLRDRPINIFVYDVQENSAPVLVFRPGPCPTTTVPPTTTTSTTSPPIIGSTTTTTTTTTRPTVPGSIPTTTVTLPPTVDIPPPTPGATLVVTPALGPAGFVTGAVGTGFPPGPVELTWSGGIGTTMTIAGPDGTFSARVLVLPRDRLGPRALVATGGGTSTFAAFLVVPSTVQPSGSDVTTINRIRRFNNR
jgi:hypothetical protein